MSPAPLERGSFVQIWVPRYQDDTSPQLSYDQEVVVIKAILAKIK